MEKKLLSLDGLWALSFTSPDGESVKTEIQVPSNIEPKLVELGLMEDYMPADDAYVGIPFELVDDWTYVKEFNAEGFDVSRPVYLNFDGIDTIAEVYLNGEKLLDCQNMHTAYRADVSKKLRERANELKVIIRSAELWAREHPHDNYAKPHKINIISQFDSHTYLRKARHQWGWDNAPRLITSGIVRSVYLEQLPVNRFEDVYTYTSELFSDRVNFAVEWIYKTEEKYVHRNKLLLTLIDGDRVVYSRECGVYHTQGCVRCTMPLSEVKLWWPVDMGEQFFYTLKLQMLSEGKALATYEMPFAIRKVELIRTKEISDDGEGDFRFKVNGCDMHVRGTNWKPTHPLCTIADKKTREGRALAEVKALNCNMIRIWGGGIYEDESFFDFCDREGILVWQDFMFACEVSTRDAEYLSEVKREAEYIVKKYRNHPSLATWCGDNENDECMAWTNEGSYALPSDNIIARKVLKDAVLRFDPYRSYVDSSPYSTDRHFLERRAGKVTHHQPESHLYPDPVDFYDALRSCKSPFIGETGPINFNSISSNHSLYEREKDRVKRSWSGEAKTTDIHQDDGYLARYRRTAQSMCLKYFGRDFEFSEWEDYAKAVNVLCAEILKDAIEYYRAHRPEKTGVIWWSLIDMWPMLYNYSVIDSDLVKKLGYYWIRQSQLPLCLMGVKKDDWDYISIFADNAYLESKNVEYTVERYLADGESEVIAKGTYRLGENRSELLQRLAIPEKAELWLIRWQDGDKECVNHFLAGKYGFEDATAFLEILRREYGIKEKY